MGARLRASSMDRIIAAFDPNGGQRDDLRGCPYATRQLMLVGGRLIQPVNTLEHGDQFRALGVAGSIER